MINVCVDCITNSHCTAPKICNVGTCVECVPGDNTCGAVKLCSPAYKCTSACTPN